ncbi:glutathione S-transferase family protein [Caldimonas thermodepolymerans]|jgi:Glutathione S-transferase|uniref:Glutathione S-transferase n=1 Tax=Caldimonas thermodepolymerans TaxID=215580 RepID=A0AA46DFI7_9BURK|nr:glutathione S-transferase family protein [Caldimonas thermodepolymerans]TCP08345.1 glutathione S-transferase [Caldimonas thermodepolymerans]UZG44808.1 glutathione S-transferase family protein [Caldimonas thermodepolymerans]UZG48542.1 glutathione S-transferase family protein [Caldimonas thermodepolymerans]
MQLYIGNKNYSSWSLRPWVLMTQAGIPFEEVRLRLSLAEGSEFKERLQAVTPAGKVPVLVDDGFAVWESLAIAEYLAEKFPALGLWPADAQARARARSVCAEMQSGFGALRTHFPMNIEASLPEVGAEVLRTRPEVGRDVERLTGMWSGLLREHGGPFLFGAFGVADAFFAPVVTRFRTYGVPVPEAVGAYMARVLDLPAMQAWVRDALAEQDFLDFDEPYRTSRG